MQKEETAINLLQSIDWSLFYQEKMALCELYSRIHSSGWEDASRICEWLSGMLGALDAIGDAAELLGLFEYPQQDEDCNFLDDAYNHVLSRQFPDA